MEGGVTEKLGVQVSAEKTQRSKDEMGFIGMPYAAQAVDRVQTQPEPGRQRQGGHNGIRVIPQTGAPVAPAMLAQVASMARNLLGR